MHTKITVTLQLSNATASDPISAIPFDYKIGRTVRTFWMHRELNGAGDWVVSDPRSGARVAKVQQWHGGLPLVSRHMSETEALETAKVSLRRIVSRVGPAKVNAKLDAAPARRGESHENRYAHHPGR